MADKFSYISDSCFKSRRPISPEAGVARKPVITALTSTANCQPL